MSSSNPAPSILLYGPAMIMTCGYALHSMVGSLPTCRRPWRGTEYTLAMCARSTRGWHGWPWSRYARTLGKGRTLWPTLTIAWGARCWKTEIRHIPAESSEQRFRLDLVRFDIEATRCWQHTRG